MTDRELMQQALEALEEISGGYSQNLIVALRERLAQPEQEPVAIVAEVHMSRYTIEWTNGPLPEGTKLYTTPPQRKPLTDEDQIAEALRRHGLTLVKTAKGYDVMNLGQITAHGVKGEE